MCFSNTKLEGVSEKGYCNSTCTVLFQFKDSCFVLFAALLADASSGHSEVALLLCNGDKFEGSSMLSVRPARVGCQLRFDILVKKVRLLVRTSLMAYGSTTGQLCAVQCRKFWRP